MADPAALRSAVSDADSLSDAPVAQAVQPCPLMQHAWEAVQGGDSPDADDDPAPEAESAPVSTEWEVLGDGAHDAHADDDPAPDATAAAGWEVLEPEPGTGDAPDDDPA